jgi:hypothetical protein
MEHQDDASKCKKIRQKGAKARPQAQQAQLTPAGRLIARFGGVLKLHEALTQLSTRAPNLSSIYRWTYPRERGGTGGLIPTRDLELVLRCARENKVSLEIDDLITHAEAPTADDFKRLAAEFGL